MRRFFAFAFFFFLVIFFLVGALLGYLYFFDYTKEREVSDVWIEIEKGESIHDVARKLIESGILDKKITFLIFARWDFHQFKAGEFRFSGKVSPRKAVFFFKNGIFAKRKVVVLPGWSMYEVADELERKKIIKDREEFLSLATDPVFLRSLKIYYDSVEGFLYPDTYFFYKHTSPRDVMKVMVDNFFRKVGKSRLEKMKKRGFYTILILASIVEEEATFDFEKPIIASVYWNRLRKGMRLQADPTAMYGLRIFHRPPRPEDLRKDNPYNTYTRDGLPPTPICSPTVSSIDAVLYPAKTDYFFFVAKGDGTHFFARTYEEHLKNIEKARILKRIMRKKSERRFVDETTKPAPF